MIRWKKVTDLPKKDGEYFCYDEKRHKTEKCHFGRVFGCVYDGYGFRFSPAGICDCFYEVNADGQKKPFYATHWTEINLPKK